MSSQSQTTYGPFYTRRVIEKLGMPEGLNIRRVLAPEEEGANTSGIVRPQPLFCEDAKGNIIITPIRLDGSIEQRSVKRTEGSKAGGHKIITWQVKRLVQPKGDMKYQYPSGKDWEGVAPLPFFPPAMLDHYVKGDQVPTIVLTEGYFKAMKGSLCGLPVIGLPSITIFKDKGAGRGGLHPDIVRFLEACKVANVIILWDGDCRNISKGDLEGLKDLTRRPWLFYKMATDLRELLKDYGVDVYLAAVASEKHPRQPKGLDDLLEVLAAPEAQADAVKDLVSFDGSPHHFHRFNITHTATLAYGWFGLGNVDAFFELHRTELDNKSFYFRKEMYTAIHGEIRHQETYAFLPEGADPGEFEVFGFYEDGCQYYIRRKEMYCEKVSNFTMKSLFLIEGVNAKRIIELQNKFGHVITAEFAISQMIGLASFKEVIEGRGNFLFEGKDSDLARIKQKLFLQERKCREVSVLGWQPAQGFWAWANGITAAGEFTPVDSQGMVEVGERHYYLPMYAAANAEVAAEFAGYRKFAHNPETKVAFKDWAQMFYEVYGYNGAMGIVWALCALYRDVVAKATGCNPMLFLFGQRGSGKGTMAKSLMCLFGEPQDPLMLGGGSTVIGFMRKLAQYQNAVVWLDEYKNDIGEKKIESLKNIWDGVGTEKGKKTSDNRTEVSRVTSYAMLSGQEMPNAEPALFSRVMLLEFAQSDGFTDAQITKYNNLRNLEAGGITSVTQELLALRDEIEERFLKIFPKMQSWLRVQVPNAIERQQVNWATLLTMFIATQDLLEYPFEDSKFEGEYAPQPGCFDTIVTERIIAQHQLMATANEVQQFFEMLQYLLSTRVIQNDTDLKIAEGCVFIRLGNIYGHYREYSRRQGMKPLDKGTLMRYFQQSKAFEKDLTYGPDGAMRVHRFTNVASPTTAFVFDAHALKSHYNVDLAEVAEKTEANFEQEPTNVGSNLQADNATGKSLATMEQTPF